MERDLQCYKLKVILDQSVDLNGLVKGLFCATNLNIHLHEFVSLH